MRDALRTVSRQHPFSLNAFVLLPDHLHCIWTLPVDDSDFASRWIEIKTKFFRSTFGSRQASENLPELQEKDDIWMPGLGEHRIIDDRDFVSHVEFIHYDPVKHRLASLPRAWPHSTFLRYVERGLYPSDWGARGEILFDGTMGSE